MLNCFFTGIEIKSSGSITVHDLGRGDFSMTQYIDGRTNTLKQIMKLDAPSVEADGMIITEIIDSEPNSIEPSSKPTKSSSKKTNSLKKNRQKN